MEDAKLTSTLPGSPRLIPAPYPATCRIPYLHLCVHMHTSSALIVRGPHHEPHPLAAQVLTRVFGNAMYSYSLPYDPVSYSMWTALTNEYDSKGKSSEWGAWMNRVRVGYCPCHAVVA